MRLRCTTVLLGLGLVGLGVSACSSNGAKPGNETTSSTSGGPGDGCAISPVLTVFSKSCATAGSCHVAGGAYPELTQEGLASWQGKNSKSNPYEQLAVPGDPEKSWIYRKVSGTQGDTGGPLMPLGSSVPFADADVIRDWIANGASVECTDGFPTAPTRIDPNTLDQDALFSCNDPKAPLSSPARIRRIDNVELSHNIVKTKGYQNPFSSQLSYGYSTYAEENTVDPATLDLFFLNLPDVGKPWDGTYASVRSHGVINDANLKCMFNTAQPPSDCLDYFVTTLLKTGVLSRAPTSEEFTHLKDYLVAAIAREPNGGQTGAVRGATLREVASVAWLTSGALFRSETGEIVVGDAAGRRRLTNEELALAVAGVLSTYRPGSLVYASGNPVFTPAAPDDAAPKNGWLQEIRAAADDGSIQDPAVLRSLIAKYASGIDLERRDVLFDLSTDRRLIPARGEYYLGARVIGFFREWLDYGEANNAFKDTPGGTSKYQTTSSPYDRTKTAFSNLQSRGILYETTLVEQLDDTIARTVMESASSGNDVFAALFTSMTWRLPSDQINLNAQTCAVNADCTDPTYPNCTSFKLCGGNVSSTTTRHARVYNVEGVPNTQAGRWVTMNSAERRGVLTHPAWLGAHGGNFEDDASIVHRGKWIRENLFCQTVPGLENVMVAAQLGEHGPSARERVDAATTTGPNAATCLGCHRLMNPLGYPFEIYDHAGFLRESDHGNPPNGKTTITNLPDPALNKDFQNAVDFSEAIAGSPYARRCFIRQAFRYFMGRDETQQDACTLAAMETALSSGSFVNMLTVLVESDTFQYRTIAEEGGTP